MPADTPSAQSELDDHVDARDPLEVAVKAIHEERIEHIAGEMRQRRRYGLDVGRRLRIGMSYNFV